MSTSVRLAANSSLIVCYVRLISDGSCETEGKAAEISASPSQN